MQKQRTKRFLAERGIAPGRHPEAAAHLAAAQKSAQAAAIHAAKDSAAEARTAAKDRRPKMFSAAENAALTAAWQPVGPTQVSTSAYGLVTGRITSLAADPSDVTGNTLYVGTTGGGVWKSTNAAAGSGATFTPLTDTLSAYTSTSAVSLSIGAVSVQSGGTGVVLAGTGDPNDASDSYYGAGILRSTDSGLTWNLIVQTGGAVSSGSPIFSFFGNSFAGFAWSTANTNTVVAAVSAAAEGIEVNAGLAASNILGLYYSQDAGATWQLATITDGPGSVVQSSNMSLSGGNAATSVVWNPIRQMFYAAVRYHGYYQSPDGVTWTRLAHQPGANFTTLNCPANTGVPGSLNCPIFRGALAVQPVTGDLFALTVDANDLDQGLWQDVCGLTSGACTNPAVQFANQIGDAALEAGSGNTVIPQADYDLYLAAIPSPQGTLLFAGTYDIYRCSPAASCTWRNTTQAGACASAQVAPAQHAIDTTFANLGLLYFGNDGGLWRTTDLVNQQGAACSTDDASHYQNLNSGLGSLAEVEDIAQDPTNAQIMMASLGALGTAAPQPGQNAWTQVLGGEGNFAAIDPQNAQNWYATSVFGVGINLCTDGSQCDASSFGQPVIGSTQIGGDGASQTIPAPWILDPQDTANILLGTCRVWRGPGTGGSGWSSASLLGPMLDGDQGPACNGNAEIRSLAASGSATDPPGTSEQIYAGMAGLLDGGAAVPGHIYSASVPSNPAQMPAWTDLSTSPITNPGSASQFNPGAFDISSIYVDPHDTTGQTVYVTIQGFDGNGITAAKVYASTTGGASWQNITSNLTDAPASSMVVDPNDANTVYVATDTGVWVTTNVGDCTNPNDNCWSVFGTSLPNAPAVQLSIFNNGADSMLRVATYGRGIWQIPLVTAGTVQTTATAAPAPLTFSAQPEETVSAFQQVVITNTGNATLNVTQIVVSGDFSETDTCSDPVAPGSTCSVNVSFLPTNTGTHAGLLTIFANVPTGQLTVSLSGTGVTGSAVVLTPPKVSFPATIIGTTAAAMDVTISNTSIGAVSLTSETVTGDYAITANTCGSTLSPNSGCTLGIAFAPSASGSRTGILTITDNLGTQTAQLSGTALAPATDALTPLSLTFSSQIVGTASQSQQVTLTNSGDQALQLISTQVSGDFSVVNNCGTSLAGHSTCAILVQFVPTRVDSETGTLTVTDAIRSQSVTLGGIGLAAAGISATPESVNFGNYGVGGTSPPQTITLTDNSGIALSALTYAVTGDFSLAMATGSCGASLAANSGCPIGIAFSPSQVGARTGTLTIAGAGLTVPLQVGLSGNGEDFSLQVSGLSTITVTSGQTATYQLQVLPVNGSSGNVSLACTGAPANSTCILNPAAITLSGNGTASCTISVTTSQTGSTAFRAGWHSYALLAVLVPSYCFLRRKPALLAFLCGGILLSAVGCGLGATSGVAPAVQPASGTSTSAGTYTITVTGTAPGLSQSVSLTLNVE